MRNIIYRKYSIPSLDNNDSIDLSIHDIFSNLEGHLSTWRAYFIVLFDAIMNDDFIKSETIMFLVNQVDEGEEIDFAKLNGMVISTIHDKILNEVDLAFGENHMEFMRDRIIDQINYNDLQEHGDVEVLTPEIWGGVRKFIVDNAGVIHRNTHHDDEVDLGGVWTDAIENL